MREACTFVRFQAHAEAVNNRFDLVAAAMRNQMAAVKFLVSPERTSPATDMAAAMTAAGLYGAFDAEFYLLTVMRHPL